MITKQEVKDISYNGLWKQNPGIIQLLGLCPLLAVSNTLVNAVSLGLATILVMIIASAAVAAVRDFVPNEARIPVFVLIIAVLVTVVEYLMNAYFYSLYNILGIFIALITTNCIILGRIEVFASKNTITSSALDAAMMGIGLMLVLALLGGARELLGQGTLLSGIDMVFGAAAKSWTITLFPDYPGFLLAILPPGAFIVLGLIIALRNWIVLRQEEREKNKPVTNTAEQKTEAVA